MSTYGGTLLVPDWAVNAALRGLITLMMPAAMVVSTK